MQVPRLLLVTDDSVLEDTLLTWWPRMAAAVEPGFLGVSLRWRGAQTADLERVCAALKAHAQGHWVAVSKRVDVANRAGVGVHLPRAGMPVEAARGLLGSNGIVKAAHNPEELALCTGADAALVSPVFHPISHAVEREALGWEGFAALVAAAPCPVLAMGGMTPEQLPAALQLGAWGVAVGSRLWGSVDPEREVVAWSRAVEAARNAAS